MIHRARLILARIWHYSGGGHMPWRWCAGRGYSWFFCQIIFIYIWVIHIVFHLLRWSDLWCWWQIPVKVGGRICRCRSGGSPQSTRSPARPSSALASCFRRSINPITNFSIKLLECPITPPPPPLSVLCHKKSGSHLLSLYFSNMVKWISPKVLRVFLTTWLRYFLRKWWWCRKCQK